MTNWYHLLFKKKLSLNLLVILPAVLGLTAFASGFVALVIVEPLLTRPEWTSPAPSDLRDILQWIRWEVLGFTCLGALAGWGIAKAILQPIRKIVSRARQITDGDFSHEIDVDNLDELGRLGLDFNRVLSSLNKYFLDHMTAGWMLLGESGEILSINSGGQKILDIDDNWKGKTLATLHTDSHASWESLTKLAEETRTGQTPQKEREITLSTPNRENVVISVSTSLFQGTDGLVVGLSMKDLTRAEEINHHLERTDQLAALGTMAAGLAHEIRNPLGSIRGLAQLLEENLPEDHPSREYTRTMAREVDRLSHLVTRLLNFSHPALQEFQPHNINNLLEQALDLVHLNHKKDNIRLSKNFHPKLPLLHVEPSKLVQAFLNVLLNAYQAVEDEGEISVTTREADPLEISGPATHAPAIVVEIGNRGKPIEPSIQSRMFDPFFTSKEEGTGLGLAITRQILASHGGTIEYRYREGWVQMVLQIPVSHFRAKRPQVSNN